MTDEHDNEMSHMEFLRAQFFSAELPPAQPPNKPRKSRAWPSGLLALKRYVRTLETLPLREQRADIFWLADRFLGLKLWDVPLPDPPVVARPEPEARP